MNLFDDCDRSDASPAQHQESSFAFLNRVDQPFWDRVRALAESWFAGFPHDHAADLRSRFRSPDANQHWPAWWELYLFALFERLGYSVTVHPTLEIGASRPDFKVENASGSFYVEAVAVNTGSIHLHGRHTAREARVLDLINKIDFYDGLIGIDFEGVGPTDLKKRQIVTPITRWLNDGSPDDLVIDDDGWTIRVYRLPSNTKRRQGHPLIAMGPLLVGMADDARIVEAAAERKRSHYSLGDAPFVVAMHLRNDPIESNPIDRMLFGDSVSTFEPATDSLESPGRQGNGLWSTSRHISGLVVGNSIHPWTVGKQVPGYWQNPNASQRVELPTLPVTDSAEEPPKGPTGAQLFGLPDEWPGPEGPFERPWTRPSDASMV